MLTAKKMMLFSLYSPPKPVGFDLGVTVVRIDEGCVDPLTVVPAELCACRVAILLVDGHIRRSVVFVHRARVVGEPALEGPARVEVVLYAYCELW